MFRTIDVPAAAAAYQAAEPFPHLIVEAAVNPWPLLGAYREWPGADWPGWRRFANGKRTSTGRAIPDGLLGVLDAFQAPESLARLSAITGIAGLRADQEYAGAGLREIPPGGSLGIHVDFNRRAGRLYRRLNVILYLNDGWRSEWGGALDLRRTPESDAVGPDRVLIIPEWNRMVIAESSERSWHGHPEPLACPSGYLRRSLAWYFFTDEPGPGYVADHSTVYANPQPAARARRRKKPRKRRSSGGRT